MGTPVLILEVIIQDPCIQQRQFPSLASIDILRALYNILFVIFRCTI